MALPHPALLDLAAGRPLPAVPEEELDRLVASTQEHRMTGLLWSRVLAGEVVLPPAATAGLAKQDLRTRSRNAQLWHALEQINTRLATIGVEVAVAKGISTEVRWYDRTGERPCNDLDLLLSPTDLPRIAEVVHLLHPGHALEASVGELMGSGMLQSIDLDVGDVEVDLHTDLLKFEVPTRQPGSLFDSRVAIVGPGGVEAWALSPEHSLVHFLLHLNKDNFARLLAYADIARILATSDLDWRLVDEFVGGEGLRVHIYSALHEVTSRLGLAAAPVPVPRGPRAALWQRLWPAENRLGGRAGLVQQRHRQLIIPWSAQGRMLEAATWWLRRRLLPPRTLVSLYYADTSGPYALRLLAGRWAVTRRNRRLARAVTWADTTVAGRPARGDGTVAPTLYKTFPPRWAHVQVPLSSPQAARAALALYAPCLRGGYAVRDATWMAVGALGPRAIPGRARPLALPVPPDQWQALLQQWEDDLGPVDGLALHSRPQKHRSGFSVLLLRAGAPLAFVRVRLGSQERFLREQAVLDLCTKAEVTTFWHPRALARGLVDGWSYLAMSAFPSERHVACERLDDAVRAELEQCLRGLPRPAGTPSHWTPMHGDLTPWNYRGLADGRRALVDWEDAGWGPPDADAVLFRATVAALHGVAPTPGPAEAVAFWRERLVTRTVRPGESIGQETIAALDRMQPR